MSTLIALGIGIFFGILVTFLILWLRSREAREVAQELLAQSESQKVQDMEAFTSRLKDSFGTLSLEALSKNTEAFLRLANETLSRQTTAGQKELEGKKQMIDQTLEAMKAELQKVKDMVSEFERDREQKFGQLSEQMKLTAELTGKLQDTTHQLREALSSSKVRGQWGERMAEDVLRLAGFIEGINYQKQKSLETSAARPDFTFFLPQDLLLNMDVKFPFDNYLRYLEAQGEADRQRYREQFLRDVKARIKEVVTRDYINPAENTLDYVLLFIPNEQIYAFIQEQDHGVLDDALRNKVILCSPVTLYAILAVVRQAVDNFNLEKTASKILSLLGSFNKQWHAFVQSMDKMGRRIEDAHKEFLQLTSTRKSQLERPLREIESLRTQRGVSLEGSLAEGNKTPHEEKVDDLDAWELD
jgi:DNA recombination protein RmuC